VIRGARFRGTSIHDLLELCVGQDLFADPGGSADRNQGGATRFSTFSSRPQPGEVNGPTAAPDILESADGETQAKLDLPAAYRGRIHSIDGALVSWYGPRIAEPIRALAGIYANL
jgi:hypothetical protein